MEIRAEEISQIIRSQIRDYEKKVEVAETGTVLSVGDGIARVHGVEKCMAMELLEFPGGIFGLALNLEEDPSIIGGLVARVGDLVLDGSVRTQLLSLKESLIKGEVL